MNLTCLFFILLFFLFANNFLFADNRSDFSNASIDSPAGIYYNDKSEVLLEGLVSENLLFPNSLGINHNMHISANIISPRIGMKVSLGAIGVGNSSNIMSLYNQFDIKIASSLGYGEFSFGFSWNLSGEHERTVNISSAGDSLLKYFEYLFLRHNNSNLRNIESNFAIQIAYSHTDILSISIYIDQLLSLSSQSVFFNLDNILSSSGFAFAIRIPRYDSYLNLRTFLVQLYASFFNILSSNPALDIDLQFKLALSGRKDITFSNSISFDNLTNVMPNSYHNITITYRSRNIYPYIGVSIPFTTYANESQNSKYINFKLGLKYKL